jgi:hypothetical protein
MDEDRPKFSCASCPNDDEPVCGSDGKTYQNSCKVKCENGVEILYRGECNPVVPAYCGCPPTTQPVCGKDHKTYQNPCHSKCMGVEVVSHNKCGAAQAEHSKKDSDLDESDPIVKFLDPKNPPEIAVLLKYYNSLFPNDKPVSEEYAKYQLLFITCIQAASGKN